MLSRKVSTLLVAVLLLGSRCSENLPPAPTVAVAEVIRGTMNVSRGGQAKVVTHPVRVEQESQVTTAENGRGSIRMDHGAFILLDRDTSLELKLDEATVVSGRVWIDATNADETKIKTSQGELTAQGATFAVELSSDNTVVYCGSGEVTFHTAQGDGRLQQGERLVLDGSTQPSPQPEDLWDDWTGGLADPSPQRFRQPTAVGRLAGRLVTALGRARMPLPVRGHDVNVAIRGDLAVTEIVQTFFNARSDVLETEYTIRLPENAIVSDFAVDNGSGFQGSTVNAWGTSGRYEISWANQHRPSSALSYDGPGRLRARIFPVEPGGTVRVRITYTEWLDRRGNVRTYVYPMGTPADPPLLGEFTLQVDTSQSQSDALRAGMGARMESQRVVLNRSDFRPRTDFYLDLIDSEQESEQRTADNAFAYVVQPPGGTWGSTPAEGDEKYVLLDIPTSGLSADQAGSGSEPPLEIVLLVDVSGATDPEELELARSTVEAVLRQFTPTDRVALLLADVTAHPPEGSEANLEPATDEHKEAVLASLARAGIGGATDLGQSLRDAAALVADRPRGAVLYLGDGLPTTGDLDATSLKATLATLITQPRFFAFGIGDGANTSLLRALFGEHAVAVHERTEASRAVMHMLAEAARPTLRNVTFDLGDAVERIFPRAPITVPIGSNLRLVGRLRGSLPETIHLNGLLDGQQVSQDLTIQEKTIDESGDVRRRWAVNRLSELLDENAGREAIVELGVRFGIVTPWTSLVVNTERGQTWSPIQHFDRDPVRYNWGLGGGGYGVQRSLGRSLGWRRNLSSLHHEPPSCAESTWVSRVTDPPPTATAVSTAGTGAPVGAGAPTAPVPTANAQAEEGLARAAAKRVLSSSERGPRGCYERRLLIRPELTGNIGISLDVDGAGVVRQAKIARSTLRDRAVEQCVIVEVQGISFPSTGINKAITIQHNYNFEVTTQEIGVRRHCSDASKQPLETRRALWRERLAANRGVGGALSVWREANRNCEMRNWRARRTLLNMMLRRVGGIQGQIQLYQAFGPGSSVAPYIQRFILRNVRTPQDVDMVRYGLGLEVPINWGHFSTLWHRNPSAQARLRLVRKWLEAIPHEMDLRVRLLALLEQTGQLEEAARVARELRADPLADAKVRTVVGEFWLRQNNEAEARRVFSEIVEYAPLDPWARRRLGDLYRAHEWHEDSYREYRTLARLRPDDPSVMLLLARAAAGAGRIDEALRLEQELSESVPPNVYQGAAAFARLWTAVRLIRLKTGASDEAERAAIVRRERTSGALREPPSLFVAVTWEHPDDHPALFFRYPTTEADQWERAPLPGGIFGIEAIRIREREPGTHTFEIRRSDRDQLRDTQAKLLIVSMPGTTDEEVIERDITLTRQQRTLRFALRENNSLERVGVQ